MFLRVLVMASKQEDRDRLTRLLVGADAAADAVASISELEAVLATSACDLAVLVHSEQEAVRPELVTRLRGRPDAPDLIAISGSVGPEERAEFLAAGCLGVLALEASDLGLAGALEALAGRRRAQLSTHLQQVENQRHELGDFVSVSPAMRTLLATARRLATTDSTVLLLGETGVGKGLLASSLHVHGPRAEEPFVVVNCGALTESLLESELFGHEKGAFTGAARARRGRFELAHRGTLFLDEITEIPPHLQVKLLSVLEDKRVQPVGSERALEIDVRIIAASNKDIALEVAEGRFRRDLYFRLNVVSLTLPPLRERREDIPELAQGYLERFRDRLGGVVQRLHEDTLSALIEYEWPGNVRELINVMERAVLLCSRETLMPSDLQAEFGRRTAGGAVRTAGEGPIDRGRRQDEDWLQLSWPDARRLLLDEAEQRYLRLHLERSGGHVGEAAVAAGLDPRSLYEKMRRHGLRKEDFRRRKPGITARPAQRGESPEPGSGPD